MELTKTYQKLRTLQKYGTTLKLNIIRNFIIFQYIKINKKFASKFQIYIENKGRNNAMILSYDRKNPVSHFA